MKCYLSNDRIISLEDIRAIYIVGKEIRFSYIDKHIETLRTNSYSEAEKTLNEIYTKLLTK